MLNFNGKILLREDEYFFDVSNHVLKIFFNKTGIKTVADFLQNYSCELKENLLYGVCDDGCKIIFIISNYDYSSHFLTYVQLELVAYIKSKWNVKLEKIDNFDGIQISGDLINKLCPRPFGFYVDECGMKIDNNYLKDQISIIDKQEIELNINNKCSIEANNVADYNDFDKIKYNSNIIFSFFESQNINNIIPIYFSIKNFIDILCLARNTEFNIELMKKDNGCFKSFADVKLFNHYRNFCNKPINECVQITSVKKNLNAIFSNLNNSKYTLQFLNFDNDEYYQINYTDIQNLLTAVELACDLDKNFNKLDKETKSDKNKANKAKATIIYNWCENYKELLKEKIFINDGYFKLHYYELTVDKIKNFRKLRNDITHRASGVIDKEICHCYLYLKYVLCYYILCIDNKDLSNKNIINFFQITS